MRLCRALGQERNSAAPKSGSQHDLSMVAGESHICIPEECIPFQVFRQALISARNAHLPVALQLSTSHAHLFPLVAAAAPQHWTLDLKPGPLRERFQPVSPPERWAGMVQTEAWQPGPTTAVAHSAAPAGPSAAGRQATSAPAPAATVCSGVHCQTWTGGARPEAGLVT